MYRAFTDRNLNWIDAWLCCNARLDQTVVTIHGLPPDHIASYLAVWLSGWLANLLSWPSQLAGWLAGWLTGWLADWLTGKKLFKHNHIDQM